MPYPNEHACRIREPGEFQKESFRRISEGRLKIVIGRLKGKTTTTTQAFRYPTDKWTVDAARKHCREHDGRFEAASESAALELRYCASVHSLITGKEQNLATFYIMNTSQNRIRWGVTDKALDEALPTILNKSLNIAEDYRPKSHFKKSIAAGTFIKTSKPDGYALATANITDPKTWKLLCDGKIGPISVVIQAYHRVCSACGALLKTEQDEHTHPCIKNGNAYRLVKNFVFEKVDFVDVPAYPQASLLHIGASDTGIIQPLELCAGFYTSQSFSGRGAGSPGLPETHKITRKGKENQMPEQTLEELKAENTRLKQRIIELEAELAKLKEAQNEEPKKDEHGCVIGKEVFDEATQKCVPITPPAPTTPEVAALKKELDQIKAERHTACVKTTVNARFDAGLIATKEDEMKRLSPFSNEYLKILTEDAIKVAAKLKATTSSPRTKYSADAKTELQAAIDKQREKFGFPVRKEAA